MNNWKSDLLHQGAKRYGYARGIALILIILAALIVCTSCEEEPSPFVLEGRVTDCATGSGVREAQVDIVSANAGSAGLNMKTVYTDDNGNYWTRIGWKEAPSVDEGNTYVYIEAFASGYVSKRSSTFRIKLDETEEVNLCLNPAGS